MALNGGAAGATPNQGHTPNSQLPSGLRECPKRHASQGYDEWRIDVDFWLDALRDANVTDSVCAAQIFFAMSVTDKRLLRTLSPRSRKKSSTLLVKLDGHYPREKEDLGYESYRELRDYRRSGGQRWDDHVLKFEAYIHNFVSKGNEGQEIPVPIQAFMLLDASNASRLEKKMAINNAKLAQIAANGQRKITYENLKIALKDLALQHDPTASDGTSGKT